MTDQQHPITPPLELRMQWITEGRFQDYCSTTEYVATQAARWGADQELEACCEWLINEGHECEHVALREGRRPKPPSLKEQALDMLDRAEWNTMTENLGNEKRFGLDEIEIIRRALEALDD